MKGIVASHSLPRALAHGAEIMFGVLVGILRLDLIAG
jgi:hypothetical protein